jgi:hypothetical protein
MEAWAITAGARSPRTPAGIDATLLARTGILPQINTGMAGKVAGVGQVGAGLVTPPAGIFTAALHALARAALYPITSPRGLICRNGTSTGHSAEPSTGVSHEGMPT